MIELEARSPVGGSQESLDGTGEVNEQVAHEEKPEQTHRQEKGNMKKGEECQKQFNLFVSLFVFGVWKHKHGEDGGHRIERSDEDSYLADPHGQQERPRGLTVRLSVTEDLRQSESVSSVLSGENTVFSYFQGQCGSCVDILISVNRQTVTLVSES